MNSAAPPSELTFAETRALWRAVHPAESNGAAFERLVDEWRSVEWSSGGTTLLAALGLQFNEVYLCRGVAWLLDPEGGHGLGSEFLRGLLNRLAIRTEADLETRIVVEEARADTRADIVVRHGSHTVVIEAKVLAGEQPSQADRLARHWQEAGLHLVFLTRTGHVPASAVDSAELWTSLTWRELARIARGAAEQCAASSGARELIETIGRL